MLVLSNADVAQVLTMAEGISALRTAYADLAIGDATYIPRIDMYAPTGRSDDYYQWGSMAGTSRSFGVAAVRIKSDVVSWPQGRTQDKYCVRPGLYSGIILLYSIVNGEPLALIQDGILQHVRVGAAAGIGVDVLARSDADSLGLIGSGGMARTYLEAIAQVRRLRSVRVYSTTKANRERFATQAAADLGLDVRAVSSAQEAVNGAAIVATATDSMEPTFDPKWVSQGAHVTCVTRRELSDEILELARGRTFQLGVHTIPFSSEVPGMEWKAGGIASYVAGTPEERKRIPASRASQRGTFPTLTDLQTGKAQGRVDAADITMFVTTGTQGLQFAAVGGRVLQLARQKGLGTALPTEWLLQDIRD